MGDLGTPVDVPAEAGREPLTFAPVTVVLVDEPRTELPFTGGDPFGTALVGLSLILAGLWVSWTQRS